MKKETTIEMLARIFTAAELIDISNDIATAIEDSWRSGFKATAKHQIQTREIFCEAAKIADKIGNKKMDGTYFRW